jgi:hypothetical protein
MRFSIRDLLWATLVVAMGLGWWLSYQAIDAERFEAVQQTLRHRAVLNHAKEVGDRLILDPMGRAVLDEPLVEP